jgi:hypothetical protein
MAAPYSKKHIPLGGADSIISCLNSLDLWLTNWRGLIAIREEIIASSIVQLKR